MSAQLLHTIASSTVSTPMEDTSVAATQATSSTLMDGNAPVSNIISISALIQLSQEYGSINFFIVRIYLIFAEISTNSTNGTRTKQQSSCSMTGTIVGGAIATPLLFTSLLLATALVCTIKKLNGIKASRNNADNLIAPSSANSQLDESLHMQLIAEASYDDVVSNGSVDQERSSSLATHLYDNEKMSTNAAYGGGYIRLTV